MKRITSLLLLLLVTACDTTNNQVEQGRILFNKKHIGKNNVLGCVACHSIKPNQVIVGPSLAGLSIRAPHLVPEQSAEEYIKESIVNPDAYITAGYLPATMYSHYAKELSLDEIESLVKYLSQLH